MMDEDFGPTKTTKKEGVLARLKEVFEQKEAGAWDELSQKIRRR